MRRTLAIAAALIAAVASGVGAAAPADVPKGWWKGTVLAEDRWDRVDSDFRYRGAATLKVVRDQPSTAEYELEYEQEVTRRVADPQCLPVVYRELASATKRAPVTVSVGERPTGVEFTILPGLRATVRILDRDPCHAIPDHELQLASISFTSRKPVSSTSHRGSGALAWNFVGQRERDVKRAGYSPTATWDLTVVGPKAATGSVKAGPVVLRRPAPSYITAVIETTQGGRPVRPDSGTCTEGPWARITRKFTVPALIGSSGVSCQWQFNNARYSGERFVGEIALTVGKAKVKRPFSVLLSDSRIGLSAPKGAVIRKRLR